MPAVRERPLSPHLTIWRWGPHMLVSILHRVTGGALTIAGLAALTWWLLSAAKGGTAYEDFSKAASHWAGLVVLIGLTWAFFQHLFSGIRHLLMDTGMNFELKSNKTGAVATIVASLICTAAVWVFALGVVK
ncbi:succinate dehydrogenase, cytochrome b556 subunit [Sphingomonas sinipercae]|uniref:Succinate dehydrogenase cytochrome b556 subunit n=1 Tax=Sphingomonas sinipercae TaxID=2714944 RepID=A0A6G7ZLC5_9SPHN|nr:succinate dehydrogenase, cytochrome b556 subunit [Sphingomonas sinipercae]QIL01797.1 succinate dehydrogenase, cytochrome b556 subunit [Sphingomonas sinipercae]